MTLLVSNFLKRTVPKKELCEKYEEIVSFPRFGPLQRASVYFKRQKYASVRVPIRGGPTTKKKKREREKKKEPLHLVQCLQDTRDKFTYMVYFIV